MSDSNFNNEQLFNLLQRQYFDNIDSANADDAVDALHEDVFWAHTQVWVHDGHDGAQPDALQGREAVRQFLADRIGQMQVIKIRHQVDQVVTDGKSGAFRGAVHGPTGDTKPFCGWVEIRDGRISHYNIGPVRLGTESIR